MNRADLYQQIRQWREDIAIVRGAIAQQSPRDMAQMLCYAHNWASNPAALWTDREHKALRRFRKWVMRRLRRMSHHWHESESGRLWA